MTVKTVVLQAQFILANELGPFYLQTQVGLMSLFEISAAEKQAAKIRLERKRGRDRKYRARNLEEIRARDRGRYAKKKAVKG